MRTLTAITRNLSIVAIAQAVTFVAGFAFTVGQARYLGPARFGELSVALSWAAILWVVLDFGLSTKLVRDVAQRPAIAGQALMAAIAVRVGLWCAMMPLVWAGTVVLGYQPELRTTILVLGSSQLFVGVAASLGSYFQGREDFLVPALGSIAQRGSAAVLGLVALALGQDLVVVATVYVIGSVLQVLVMIPGLRNHPISPAPPAPRAVVAMVRGTATLGFFWIFGAIYFNIDMLILERLVPPENVAWYAAAYRLFNVAYVVVAAVTAAVLYPVLSRLSVGSREGFRAAVGRSFTFHLASGTLMALILVIAADQLVAFVYPASEYGQAASALRLLAPGLVAMYVNSSFFLVLFALGFERRLLVMAAVLAVLNPIANVMLIPLLQQNGAALITSATEAIILVWGLALLPKDVRAAASPRVIAKILLAALPAAACLLVFQDWSPLVRLPVTAIVYGVAVLALGVVPESDLLAIRSVLSTRPGAPRYDGAPVISPGTTER